MDEDRQPDKDAEYEAQKQAELKEERVERRETLGQESREPDETPAAAPPTQVDAGTDAPTAAPPTTVDSGVTTGEELRDEPGPAEKIAEPNQTD